MTMKQSEAPTTYFGRLRPGDLLSAPSWLLRRTGPVDELLGRDGVWRPSDMLARTERGELPGKLKPMGTLLPRSLTAVAQRQHRAVRRALDRQRVGEFVLRLAFPGPCGPPGELDSEAVAEMVGFLTRAPVVTAGPSGTFRTDGMWVWPESIADDVRAAGATPEDLFCYHIHSRDYYFPETVEPSVIERARRLLESAAAVTDGERVREANVPGMPPPLTQEERLRALSAWHAEWERRHTPSTPFRPERHAPDSGYNLHHVDVDASPEADAEYFRRSREIMGLDPETGALVDI